MILCELVLNWQKIRKIKLKKKLKTHMKVQFGSVQSDATGRSMR